MNLDELANRLVKCKHFRWMPGIKTMKGARVIVSSAGDLLIDELDFGRRFVTPKAPNFARRKAAEELPDLTDPATLGCLLHLVREAWGDHRAVVTYCDEGWRFEVWNSDNFFPDWPLGKCFPTEAEALVEAAEAAS